MGSVDHGPIIIGGPDRCGKTLLRSLLAEHPNVAIPEVGSNMWTFFHGQYGDLSQPANFERCLAAMLRYKHVRFLQPDAERIRKEFWQGAPTYGRLFALFHQHYAERQGKPRWGDQTGLIERYADQVFAAYPTAKMLHMVRDPRDRYEASLALWPNGKGRAGGATARWLYSVGLAKRNLKRYPGRYRVVQYEALVRDPEATLRGVCAFLGEEYSPAMLALAGTPSYRGKAANATPGEVGGNAITTAFVGRYRSAIPAREIAFMQAFAGREMVRLGYEPAPLTLSLRDWLLLYLVDWPANLARMLSWRALEAAQQSFPAAVGRKPGAKMTAKASAT
jgi:hypothetical protein